MQMWQVFVVATSASEHLEDGPALAQSLVNTALTKETVMTKKIGFVLSLLTVLGIAGAASADECYRGGEYGYEPAPQAQPYYGYAPAPVAQPYYSGYNVRPARYEARYEGGGPRWGWGWSGHGRMERGGWGRR